MSKYEKNLSQGNVAKQLIIFAFPFLISNIIQSLYNVADMLIVGNYCGTASISGVGISGQITFILTNIIAGLCTGGTILIAQYLGSNNREALKKTISTLITTLIFSAFIITVIMLFFKNPILRLLKTPAEAFQESSNYLLVTSLGILFIFGYNALSAIMRGMGDSKRPFFFVLIACGTNIILDFVLVGLLDLKATGAAVATVASQALSMILCIIYLSKNGFIFDFKLKSYKIDTEQFRQLFKVGLPTAVQNGVVGISFLFITTLVNTIGGVDASAAVSVVGKLNGFATLPAVAMSSSISAMAAQNIGANRWDRALETTKIGTIISVVMSWIILSFMLIFPAQLLKLFDNTNPAMIADGVAYMRTFCLEYILVPIFFSLNGLFIGAGHTTFTFINSMFSSIIFRIPAAYLFGEVLNWGIMGIGLAAPVASFVSFIIVIGFFFSGKWKTSTIIKSTAN